MRVWCCRALASRVSEFHNVRLACAMARRGSSADDDGGDGDNYDDDGDEDDDNYIIMI